MTPAKKEGALKEFKFHVGSHGSTLDNYREITLGLNKKLNLYVFSYIYTGLKENYIVYSYFFFKLLKVKQENIFILLLYFPFQM